MIKRDLYRILFLICFWEICAIFITYYDASVIGFKSEIDGGHYNFITNLSIVLFTCLIGAFILGSLEVFFLSKIFRKKPLGISLLIKTSIYILFILFFSSIAFLYIYSTEIARPMFSKEVIDLFVTKYLSARVFSTFVFWSIACMLALFFLQINEKFGQGVLLNFLLGKYNRPKEDRRIFMFMDLKSSTTIAENWGILNTANLYRIVFLI